MIARVTGDIVYRGVGFVIVDCQGLGYKVVLPDELVGRVPASGSFYTHEVQRDDQRELFGFDSVDALELFWRLIGVSGVGPRSGQKIVYAAPVGMVKEQIMGGNLAFLTNISGIGTKTAQKIILELKGAFVEEPASASVDADALEALVGLGYARKQAEDVLAMVDADSSEERVKKALKLMGRSV